MLDGSFEARDVSNETSIGTTVKQQDGNFSFERDWRGNSVGDVLIDDRLAANIFAYNQYEQRDWKNDKDEDGHTNRITDREGRLRVIRHNHFWRPLNVIRY